MRRKYLISILLILNLFSAKLSADELFQPAMIVNEKIITQYELSQRVKFLRVFEVSNDFEEKAKNELIDEKIILDLAKSYGIEILKEEINIEILNLANQFDQSLDFFLGEMEKLDIAQTTIEKYLSGRLLLNKVVQAKFINRANISDKEIDAFIINGSSTIELLLSEIVLPFNLNSKQETFELAKRLKEKLEEGAAFSALAQSHSKAPTASNDGIIGWVPLERIPKNLSQIFLTSPKGTIVGPEPLNNMFVLYKFSNSRQVPLFPKTSVILEFIELRFDSSIGENFDDVVTIFRNSQSCSDVQFAMQEYKDLGDQIIKTKSELEDIPIVMAKSLNKLDVGEYSSINGDKNSEILKLIMLCAREQAISGSDREFARQYLITERLKFLAESLLADLKSDARIILK